MSKRYIRCAHCGLPHDAHISVCPTTGLRIERHDRSRTRRRAHIHDNDAEERRRLIGQIIDRKYRVLRVIGKGGMGSVFDAEHLGLDRRVALKVLHPSLADDPEAIARLRHEAQVVSAIGHPNICEVYDLGRTAYGSPYLVMELLMGESLADRLKLTGPFRFSELAPLMKQVLSALAKAHDKGILHRDLKPENIYIEESRSRRQFRAKLLDFGIAKSMTYDFVEQERLTHTGMVMGTPYYMAPEQARGDSGLDQRVDLWAIGVIIYEALTGRRPFVATNYNALLVKILTSRPRPVQRINPTIPDSVAAMIEKALSKLREDRYQTAREFIRVINQVDHLCAAEDPHEPTRILRRPPPAQLYAETRAEPAVSHADWGRSIEDPETFVDDEAGHDASLHQAPAMTSREQLPAPWPSQDDYDAEPVEPTIKESAQEIVERLDYSSVGEAHDAAAIARSAAGDYEYSNGGSRSPHAVRPPVDSLCDTDIIDFRAKASRPGTDDHQTRHDPRYRRHPHPARMEEDRTARQPRIPRPSSLPDDEEKTTLYDMKAAKARRRQQQAKRGSNPSGSGSDDSGAA